MTMYQTESWTIMNTMKRIALGALVLVATSSIVGSAEAARPAAPGCHVISVVETKQHVIGTTRTVTTTTSKCRGRMVTTVTYGAWYIGT